VISYSYLWAEERRRGREEGLKNRPCAIVVVTQDEDGEHVVTVLPVSHAPQTDPTLAVEIPPAVKRRLKLDEERSWIVLSEANRFIWPGPDLRPLRTGDAAAVAYGLLPFALFEQVRTKLIAAIRAKRLRVVPRTK
jgi:hypothetical protein